MEQNTNLSILTQLLKGADEFKRLLGLLQRKDPGRYRVTLTQAAKTLVAGAVYNALGKPVLLVASDVERAISLYHQLPVWLLPDTAIHYFPENAGGDIASVESLHEKITTLTALLCGDGQHGDAAPSRVVVTSILAMRQRIISPAQMAAARKVLRVGGSLSPNEFLKSCLDMGYEADTRVEVQGTFARRGGILDIFPGNSEYPVRVELEGRIINSIRYFDPKTQLSVENLQEIVIHSVAEIANPQGNCTLLDYLPVQSVIIFDEYIEIFAEKEHISQPVDAVGTHEAIPYAEDSRYLVSLRQIEEKCSLFSKLIDLTAWDLEIHDPFCHIKLPVSSMPQLGGRMETVMTELKQKLREMYAVVICSQQRERLFELLEEGHLHVHKIKGMNCVPEKGTISLVKGSLQGGWTLQDSLALLTDYEVFGWVKQERTSRRRAIRHHLIASQLKEGDFVVHIDHGIARFSGFQKMKAGEVESEYMILEYAAGDRLYVPASQMERVGPYVGGRDRPPSLSRLHTQEWAQTKARIKKSVEDIARELLELYALREASVGYSFSADTLWQGELESSFPYIETPDQLDAVEDVKRDMEINKPMDRLICGDVGYGKTEIALRAAFKAVMDSKQVAVLVPTTVLAQQHYLTFYSRLQAFPINLGVLSRFTEDKEQTRIISGLAEGCVDICIGTHRLLQKDISFKKLGLVIIDEEQRFGVAHKEFFKKLRTAVDILTLSATPIPRTMHMSLSGIKDLSILETPPEDRLPIKTFVGPYDARKVRDAILYELARCGQIYYVYNRVQDILSVAAELGKLVPEARISVAHGQMHEVELERVMTAFIEHKTDILLTTTIIESGIDIPNANTLIIDNSDRLGLTQLYQLRGRIGRGASNAFAYFFFRLNRSLTEQARKRLNTIAEATELGAGYAIAMKDLEIRGAGNLLGTAQSGYISAVGFDLYCRLLADAVETLRSGHEVNVESVEKFPDPSISLPLRAFIPQQYVAESADRVHFYRLIAAARHETEFARVEAELKDRFGPLPQQVQDLLYVARIRKAAAGHNLYSIVHNKQHITLQYQGDLTDVLPALQRISARYQGLISVGTAQVKLAYREAGKRWQDVLMEILASPAITS